MEATEKGRELLDYTTNHIFTDFSPWRLLRTGCAVKFENDMEVAAKRFYPSVNLLDNQSVMKCFAVCASIDDSNIDLHDDHHDDSNDGGRSTTKKRDKTGKISNPTIEPFLVRSYRHPLDPTSNQNTNDQSLYKSSATKQHASNYYQSGTSNMKLYQAIGATCAQPGAFDRIKATDANNNPKILADGGICSNCPVVIALKEAQSIWPHRRIDVVLSLGVEQEQDRFAQEAIDAVRLNHPSICYERLILPKISRKFGLVETDLKRIKEMERLMREYMRKPEVEERLKIVVEQVINSS